MRLLRFARQKAAALPFTLMLVAFNVTVVVALLIYATTELNASRNSLGADVARTMALNGVELAGALIAANSTNNAFVSYQNIITNLSGDTNARLETKIANTVAPDSDLNWKRTVQNPTALHSGFAAPGEESVDLNYAADATGESGYIAPRKNPANSNWRNLHENMFRMKWVNIYKGDSSQSTNLIGRFAFWVDDESTKLNINYSGSAQMYSANDEKLLGLKTYLPNARGLFMNPSATNNSEPMDGAKEFAAKAWPLYIDLGGINGITRTNARNILTIRGEPHEWAAINNTKTFVGYRPYYSPLEVRRGDSNAITNISQQSQFAFTATMFSREPELSFARGVPRFDMFKIGGDFAKTNIPNVYSNFISNIFYNYPKFENKYSWPQFAAALKANYQEPPGDGANAPKVFSYQSNLGTTNFNARGLPLINETDIQLSAYTNASGYQVVTINATVELIIIAPCNSNTGYVTYFNELGIVGFNNFQNTVNRYKAKIEFDPPISIGSENIQKIELKQKNANTNNWFHQKFETKDKNYLRILDTDLTGCFGLLTNSQSWTNTNVSSANSLIWTLPSTMKTSVYYQINTNDTSEVGLYHTASSQNTAKPEDLSQRTVYLTNQSMVVYHVTSHTSGASGVRGDPRLGLHTMDYNAAPNLAELARNYTNSIATLGKLNTTWQPDSPAFLDEPLSPDITSSHTVFESDAGFPIALGETGWYTKYMNSSADIGEVPITTFKNGYHLSWSTPRLWGDGRDFMGGIEYPPDWLLLDCIHTAMLPAEIPALFCSTNNYAADEHNAYGRLNVNGLKTYFQTPLGSSGRSDTIMDSMVANIETKDFRWNYNTNDSANFPVNGTPPNFGSSTRVINAWDNQHRRLRTNVLSYIESNAIYKNANNKPYLLPYEFTARLAGSTNLPNLGSPSTPNTLMFTNGGYWEAYTNGATNTSDRRIESLVRSLQQRVTTRGWQYSVYSLGQAIQVVEKPPFGSGNYQTNIVGEAYMQAVWERAPKHDVETGEIVNASPGGAPPVRMLYLREIR